MEPGSLFRFLFPFSLPGSSYPIIQTAKALADAKDAPVAVNE